MWDSVDKWMKGYKGWMESSFLELDAELRRKKDPWAMDVRLHKILEGLTGQSVVRGGIAPWKAFWKQEGASFAVRPKTKPGEEEQRDDRYKKFFDLTIESDRVLFVLDFSGSMAEPVELKADGNTAGGGAPTQAANSSLTPSSRATSRCRGCSTKSSLLFSNRIARSGSA